MHSESTRRLMPKSLNTRHRALMRMLVAGVSVKDAARALGYNEERAYQISMSPLFKEEMERMRREVDKRFIEGEAEKPSFVGIARGILEDAAPEAAQALVDILRTGDIKHRQMSAKEILDRVGVAGEKGKGEGVSIEVSDGLAKAIEKFVVLVKMKEGSGENKVER